MMIVDKTKLSSALRAVSLAVVTSCAVVVSLGCDHRLNRLWEQRNHATDDYALGCWPLPLSDGQSADSLPELRPTVSCEDGYCLVPPGCYRSGSNEDRLCRGRAFEDKKIGISFLIGQTEVTQNQYAELMKVNPAYFREDGAGAGLCDGQCPVENVTWHDAAAYCNALSRQQGLRECYRCEGNPPGGTRCTRLQDEEPIPFLSRNFGTIAQFPWPERLPKPTYCSGYRLATPDEWEHAARVVSRTALPTGPIPNSCQGQSEHADPIAWYDTNSEGHPHQVATKQANGFGIFDMHGNVAEWTDVGVTVEAAEGEALRGGSWEAPVADITSASSQTSPREEASPSRGFRCVRSIVKPLYSEVFRTNQEGVAP